MDYPQQPLVSGIDVKVTVIVLAYNHEKFIAEALNSVLMQRADFFYEIVVVEDCSTDSTREVLRAFQRSYPNIVRLVLAERNQNDNRAWGRAILEARGRYVALLDGDDYWTSPQKLQKQVEFLNRHPQCSVCFHGVEILHEDQSREALNSGRQKEFSTVDDILEANFLPTGSVMLRRGAVTSFPEWWYQEGIGDWELFLFFAQKGDIGYIDENMSVYRKHAGGVYTGSGPIGRMQSRARMYNNLLSHLEPRHKRTVSAILSKYYYDLALQCLAAEDWRNAKKYSVMSLCVSPRNARLAIIDRLGLCSRLYAPKFYNFVRYFRASAG